jgi:hypothetical protein
MLNEMFVKLSILREPNMEMCTLVVYPGPLSFSGVMPVWTWKFDTIHCALCHLNSSHMLNEMFVKLSILQDPNVKMCTLVPYPGPLSFSRVMPKTNVQLCAFKHRNSSFELFFTKIYDIGPMDLHEILLFSRS